MQITIELSQLPFSPDLIRELGELASIVFDGECIEVGWRLTSMPDASVFCVRIEGKLIGFKIGYAMTERKYYSWIGGVHPGYRRAGVAGNLMNAQHEWLMQKGYALSETATDRENTAMAQLNLKHGYVVAGTRSEPERVQVLFLKQLRDAGA